MQKNIKLLITGVILFALLGIPSYGDWYEGDEHKMHFPQLPDEVGWDVACYDPIILADDWQCSETGLVNDIHFWGSWRDLDGDLVGDVGNILGFRIQIYSDMPAAENPDGFSKPDSLLRDWYFEAQYFIFRPIDGLPNYLEGWLDPTIPPPLNVWYNDHGQYFQYNLVGIQDLVLDPFIQEEGTIYWLAISAVVEQDDPQPEWGWKSSTDHFNDDAVVGTEPLLDWQELFEPPRLGTFNIAIAPDGSFMGGGGINYYENGTSVGGWYWYENTGWWNIWFYDNPFSFDREKEVQISFVVNKIDPSMEGFLTLAINYSTPEWPPDGPPPLPPLTPLEESLFVGRTIVYELPLADFPTEVFIDTVLEMYNPEWVSIDVQGVNFEIFGGNIYHECVDRITRLGQSLDLAFVITGFPVETGACCYDDGTCLVTTQTACESVLLAQYMGDGTDCSDISPPNGIADICEQVYPDGACCYSDGSCIVLDSLTCIGSGGVWAGAGTVCLGDSNSNYIDDACEGYYDLGACCMQDLSCIVTYQDACTNVLGGQWMGAGTDCSDLNSNGIADICEEEPPDSCDYYKSAYPDYAPAGVPDFDQKQDFNNDGIIEQTWCGPTALANCFWWFDSKFEPFPVDPRPFGMVPPNDGYPLVTDFTGMGLDDHNPANVLPFVDSLALYCMTDIAGPGTVIWDLANGAQNWLASRALDTAYTINVIPVENLEFIQNEVLRSQNVILLLGFWEETGLEYCERIGGHYVTIAGTCTQLEPMAFCVSDPFFDYNEGDPPIPPHGSAVHNDAQYVSGPHGTMHHDKYYVGPTTCMPNPIYPFYFPFEFLNYPINPLYMGIFYNQNLIDPMIPGSQYQGGLIHTILEFALIICPAEEHIPDIDVLPDTVGFRRCIDTDTTYTAQFQVCNVSTTAPLSLDSITCDLGFVTATGVIPATIAPSSCANIDVNINTNSVITGSYTGYFHVYSDDPDEPVVNKPFIRVDVIAQDINVSPDSLAYSQAADTSIVYTGAFAINNGGGCDLSWSITNYPSWAVPSPIGPGVLAPLSSYPIDLTINTAGMSAGTYIDSITIISDDPDTPTLFEPIIVLQVTSGSYTFDYLPGDANMFAGSWPPSVLGADVTYLVNYFRGLAAPCYMYNPSLTSPYFYASADANGDCSVIGSDVTFIVNYFRGLATITYCPNYPPNFPPVPSIAPAGWPNCAIPPPTTKQIIPTQKNVDIEK